MKYSTLAAILALLFISNNTLAQNLSPKVIGEMSKWKVNQFNFGLGIDSDNYTSMSLTDLLVFAKDPHQMQRDLSMFNEEATTFTAGVALYTSASFSPLNRMTGKYKTDQELQIGIGLHSPKEAMISYKNEQLDSSIVFCNLHGEVTFEAAYLKRHIWNEKFHWYYGLGMNAGTSFGNEMMIISGAYFEPGAHPSTQESEETNVETFQAKHVLYSRVYIPYGLHYQVSNHWTMGLDFRYGIGMQSIQGEKTN
ncbi:MAG: hypothetical protein HKN75_09505, partial [Bacteroidia bacterium]|nr:hypothetical protein [Bacteroidia bacterium]